MSIDEARLLIARVPGWEGMAALTIEPLEGGLTNQTFRVEVGGEPFVLRVSGENTRRIGIDHEADRPLAPEDVVGAEVAMQQITRARTAS